MTKNMGKIDRFVRFLLGVGLLSLAVAGPTAPWGYSGVVLILFSLIGWCPPYALFGISTCSRSKTAERSTDASSGWHAAR